MTTTSWPQAQEYYYYESPGDYADKQLHWTSPTFLLSGDKHTYFFDWSNAAGAHNLMASSYFVAPFDGVYTFHGSSDDQMELRYDFDSNGSYKFDLRLDSQTGISTIQHYGHPDAVGERRFMKKGERVYLESVMSSWYSHSRLNVGIIYHGKDESTWTWLDNRQKSNFNGRAQYVYDSQARV